MKEKKKKKRKSFPSIACFQSDLPCNPSPFLVWGRPNRCWGKCPAFLRSWQTKKFVISGPLLIENGRKLSVFPLRWSSTVTSAVAEVFSGFELLLCRVSYSHLSWGRCVGCVLGVGGLLCLHSSTPPLCFLLFLPNPCSIGKERCCFTKSNRQHTICTTVIQGTFKSLLRVCSTVHTQIYDEYDYIYCSRQFLWVVARFTNALVRDYIKPSWPSKTIYIFVAQSQSSIVTVKQNCRSSMEKPKGNPTSFKEAVTGFHKGKIKASEAAPSTEAMKDTSRKGTEPTEVLLSSSADKKGPATDKGKEPCGNQSYSSDPLVFIYEDVELLEASSLFANLMNDEEHDYEQISKRLAKEWEVGKGQMDFIERDNDWIEVRFNNARIYSVVLKPWKIRFIAENDRIYSVETWIRIMALPSEFLNTRAVKYLLQSNGAGEFVKLDVEAIRMAKMRYMRVCINLHLEKTIIRRIVFTWKDGKKQSFNVYYEDIPVGGGNCGEPDHPFQKCPLHGKSNRINKLKFQKLENDPDDLAEQVNQELQKTKSNYATQNSWNHYRGRGRRGMPFRGTPLPRKAGPKAQFVPSTSSFSVAFEEVEVKKQPKGEEEVSASDEPSMNSYANYQNKQRKSYAKTSCNTNKNVASGENVNMQEVNSEASHDNSEGNTNKEKQSQPEMNKEKLETKHQDDHKFHSYTRLFINFLLCKDMKVLFWIFCNWVGILLVWNCPTPFAGYCLMMVNCMYVSNEVIYYSRWNMNVWIMYVLCNLVYVIYGVSCRIMQRCKNFNSMWVSKDYYCYQRWSDSIIIWRKADTCLFPLIRLAFSVERLNI